MENNIGSFPSLAEIPIELFPRALGILIKSGLEI